MVFSSSGNSTLLLVDRLAWGDTNPTLVSLTRFLQAGNHCLGLTIILCISSLCITHTAVCCGVFLVREQYSATCRPLGLWRHKPYTGIFSTRSTSWDSLSWTRPATAFAIARKASNSASREARVRSVQITATDHTKVLYHVGLVFFFRVF